MEKILILIVPLLVASCGQSETAQRPNAAVGEEASNTGLPSAPGGGGGWNLASSGEGVSLVRGPAGSPAIRLICPTGENRLLVNVPSFEPIGSEERLSFGGGGDVVALVADTRGDTVRGGVTGSGEVPAEFSQLLAGQISANYGAQDSGPHEAPPQQLASAFAAACDGTRNPNGDGDTAPSPSPEEQPAEEPVSACLMQGDKRIAANRLKAVGTEPFWAARIEGRCVTYSHPENQAGTRVWTTFNGSRNNGTWTGYLNNQRFVLRTREQPGCSDGMSDKRYPIAVALTIGSDRRTGCAEPI